MVDGVDELMRVADAEAGEHHAALVRFAVAIRVAEVEQLVVVADEHAAVARLHAVRHRQPVGVFPRLGHFAIGQLADHDGIVRRRTDFEVRIARRTRHEHPPALVPRNLHRLHHAILFGSNERHLVAIGHGESGELLLRRERLLVRRRRVSRRRRRGFLAVGDCSDAGVSLREQRAMLGKSAFQIRLPARRSGERLRGSITIGEVPIGRPPALRPEAVLGGDCSAKLLSSCAS